MLRFRFPLDGLLHVRRLSEQREQRAVAALERERWEIERGLRTQQQALASGREAMRAALTGTLDAQALRLHAASSIQQMRQAQRLVLEMAGVHRRLEAARALLIEASRARRALELLREKRLAEWRAGVDRAENNALDELAVIAAARAPVDGLYES
jgi:flagellar protein FliJ